MRNKETVSDEHKIDVYVSSLKLNTIRVLVSELVFGHGEQSIA